MPKYWGKQIFAHGRFPKVGQKQKTEKKKKREDRKDRKLVITMAKLRMAHASTHGARKLPGPIDIPNELTLKPVLHILTSSPHQATHLYHAICVSYDLHQNVVR